MNIIFDLDDTLYLDCFEINSSHKIFKKVSNKYRSIITMPFTPFALSSGNTTEIMVANTIMDKNHVFS